MFDGVIEFFSCLHDDDMHFVPADLAGDLVNRAIFPEAAIAAH